jgi:hypothetical protein
MFLAEMSNVSFKLRTRHRLLCLGGHMRFMIADITRSAPASRSLHPRRMLIAGVTGVAVRIARENSTACDEAPACKHERPNCLICACRANSSRSKMFRS